jgi:hypothetical protein
MLTLIQDQFARFLEEDDDEPVVMLNLLRFHADGGRQRYSDHLSASAERRRPAHSSRLVFSSPRRERAAKRMWDRLPSWSR